MIFESPKFYQNVSVFILLNTHTIIIVRIVSEKMIDEKDIGYAFTTSIHITNIRFERVPRRTSLKLSSFRHEWLWLFHDK